MIRLGRRLKRDRDLSQVRLRVGEVFSWARIRALEAPPNTLQVSAAEVNGVVSAGHVGEERVQGMQACGRYVASGGDPEPDPEPL